MEFHTDIYDAVSVVPLIDRSRRALVAMVAEAEASS